MQTSVREQVGDKLSMRGVGFFPSEQACAGASSSGYKLFCLSIFLFFIYHDLRAKQTMRRRLQAIQLAVAVCIYQPCLCICQPAGWQTHGAGREVGGRRSAVSSPRASSLGFCRLSWLVRWVELPLDCPLDGLKVLDDVLHVFDVVQQLSGGSDARVGHIGGAYS